MELLAAGELRAAAWACPLSLPPRPARRALRLLPGPPAGSLSALAALPTPPCLCRCCALWPRAAGAAEAGCWRPAFCRCCTASPWSARETWQVGAPLAPGSAGVPSAPLFRVLRVSRLQPGHPA